MEEEITFSGSGVDLVESSVNEYFEREQHGNEDAIDLNTVFVMMSDDAGEFFRHLPGNFQAEEMLLGMKIPQQFAIIDHAQSINHAIDHW